MDHFEVNFDVGAFAISAICLIYIFSVMRTQVKYNSAHIEELKKNQEKHEDKVSSFEDRFMQEILTIKTMVAKIEGVLSK